MALLRGVERVGHDMLAAYVPPEDEGPVCNSQAEGGGTGQRARTVASEARTLRCVLEPLQE